MRLWQYGDVEDVDVGMKRGGWTDEFEIGRMIDYGEQPGKHESRCEKFRASNQA